MVVDWTLRWAAMGARFAAAAAALALTYLVRGFADYPGSVAGTLLVLVTVPAVAAFGAHWRAPARWTYFAGPVALLVAGYLFAVATFEASVAAAGVGPVSDVLVQARLVPQVLVSIPPMLLGTVAAAVVFEDTQGLEPRG